eukprot:TRINITY_DN23010_c0_g1_i1.p1 TRINITY_DN23010_c0_g1~~TRINITY_DN23010_c0_g1_i1.p1  ORF type:complete len:651 (+),score=165.62 TRINITY_DN23010_c0_g1_i1:34-1986(+)
MESSVDRENGTEGEAWIDDRDDKAEDLEEDFGPLSVMADVTRGGKLRIEVIKEHLIYKVKGPASIQRWQLERNGAMVGEISPLTHITMSHEARENMEIPRKAIKYAFLYPPLRTEPGKTSTPPDDEEKVLLTNGGFVYFGRNQQVIRINAISLVGNQILNFDGPHRLDMKMTNTLFSQGLMKPVSLSHSSNTRFFAWLPAATQVHPPLASGGFFFSYDDMSRNRYFRLLPPDKDVLQESTEGSMGTPKNTRKLSKVFSTFRLFKALEEIGRGGFGTVYRGVRQDTGEHVAMKVVPLKEGCDAGKIQREFQTMRSLAHDNVVEIFAFYRTEKRAVIVMELVPFGTLGSLIRDFGSGLPVVLLVRLLQQVVHGVQYLHSMNTIHGDLKPANILCTSDGKIKLADFGGARSLAQSDDNMNLPHTPLYCSPEALRGIFSTASDVWAVGCIALEMNTGLHPWNHVVQFGAELETICYNYIPKVDHPLPEGAPDMLVDLIKGCMERDQKARMDLSQIMHSELFHMSEEELLGVDFQEDEGMPPRIPTGAFPCPEDGGYDDGLQTASNFTATAASQDTLELLMQHIKDKILGFPGLIHTRPHLLDAVRKATIEVALGPSRVTSDLHDSVDLTDGQHSTVIHILDSQEIDEDEDKFVS